MRNVSYPIHFTETYQDQEKPVTGAAAGVAAYAKHFSWENIRGTTANVIGDGSCVTDPCWYASLGKYFFTLFVAWGTDWVHRSKSGQGGVSVVSRPRTLPKLSFLRH